MGLGKIKIRERKSYQSGKPEKGRKQISEATVLFGA